MDGVWVGAGGGGLGREGEWVDGWMGGWFNTLARAKLPRLLNDPICPHNK